MKPKRAIKLIQDHRVRIARALVRQSRALAPSYARIDAAAHERSFMAMLTAAERVLDTGNADAVLDQLESVAQIRAATGFRLDEFMMACFGMMPVLRRFLLEHIEPLEDAVDEYEAVEAVAIPIIARAAVFFADAGADDTLTGEHSSVSWSPFTIESVIGSPDEEVTAVRERR